jgi:predicted dehydrogenase
VAIQAQKSYKFGNARPDFYKKRETYSGSVLWVTSHAFDFVAWTTGLDYRSVTGLGGNLAKPDYGEMEDHVALLCEMSNGASCVIHGDYLRPAQAPTHGDDRLRVVGSDGVLEVRDGLCIAITNEEELRILEMSAPKATDTARGLLAAVRGEADARITTGECLRIAEVLLRAREATDEKKVLEA